MDPRLTDVLRRVFRVSEVTPRTSPDTVKGWDSLGHLALVADLEREFDVQFSPDEVMEMISVRAIADILAEHGAIGERRS